MGTTVEKIEYALDTKDLIKEAIIDKGQEVTEETTLREYAQKIADISSGGDDSTAFVYGESVRIANNTPYTITSPINSGLCVVFVLHRDTVTVPSDWTLLYTTQGSRIPDEGYHQMVSVFYKHFEDPNISFTRTIAGTTSSWPVNFHIFKNGGVPRLYEHETLTSGQHISLNKATVNAVIWCRHEIYWWSDAGGSWEATEGWKPIYVKAGHGRLCTVVDYTYGQELDIYPSAELNKWGGEVFGIMIPGAGAPEPITVPISITENGEYDPPDGVDGFSHVAVDVPSEEPTIEPLMIVQNGTYTPPLGVDGYSPITVQVPGSSSRLPQEYQEVDYLEATGTQYIDTDITEVTGIDIKFSYRNNLNDTSIYGARDSSSSGRFGLTLWSSSFHIMPPGYNVASSDTVVHTLQYGEFTQWHLVWDGQDIYTGADHSYSTKSLYLFGENQGTIWRASHSIIFETKLYKADVLVSWLIPCYRRADLVCGFYDLMRNKFLVNSGSGEFLHGTELNKNIQPIQITRNTTVYAPSGVDGYSPITVQVPDSETAIYQSAKQTIEHMAFSSVEVLTQAYEEVT